MLRLIHYFILPPLSHRNIESYLIYLYFASQMALLGFYFDSYLFTSSK